MRVPRIVRFSIFIVVVIVVIVGLVFGIRALLGGGRIPAGEASRSKALVGESVTAFADGYIASDGIRLRCYSAGDKLKWEYAPDANANAYTVSEKLVALWRAENLHVLDESGQVTFKKSLASEISLARCGVANVAAYLPAGKTIEVLAKADGKVIDSIAVAGEVLGFGFYSDADLLWVLLLSTDTTTPTSYLNTYQPGKSQTGGNPFEDQIIYDVHYSQTNLYAVGTRNVNTITSTQILEKKPLVFGWQMIDVTELKEGIAMLFTLSGESATGKPERLKVVRADGSEKEMHLPSGCIGAYIGAKGVWGVAPSTIYFLPFSGSSTTYTLPFTIDAVGTKLSQNRVMVQVGNEIQILQLP